MPESNNLLAFAIIALGMVLTPGPNMVYLISRAICQGRSAGSRSALSFTCCAPLSGSPRS